MIIFKNENKKEYLLEYLDRVGNKSFSEYSFNIIDALILSILSYIRFDFMKEKENEILNLKNALEIYFLHPELVKLDEHNLKRRSLLKELINCSRFNNLTLFNYENDLDESLEQQFGAISIILNYESVFLSFRGTDITLTGIKEDMNMSYSDLIPSQIMAKNYISNKLYKKYKNIYIGGHSKGGNLAIYSALCAKKKIKDKIKYIFNFDGPGFNEEISKNYENEIIFNKVVTLVPEMSLVGMILNKPENTIVVDSDAFGIDQHNPFSWKIDENNHFILATFISKTSKVFNNSVKDYFLRLSQKDREKFVSILWELLSATKIKTIVELKENMGSSLLNILIAYKRFDDEEKELLKKNFALISKILVSQIRHFNDDKNIQNLNRIENLYKIN